MRRKLWLLLLTGFLFRLFLSSFGTLELDFNTYLAWSNRLVESGFANFYQIWSDYLPGYLYILWFLGQLKLWLPFLPTVTLYKLPAILADVASAYLIFKLIKSPRLAFLATVAYLFNPAVFANSTFWGQTDSLIALAALLWLYCVKAHRPWLAAIVLGLGTAIKPTLVLLAPFVIRYTPYALMVFIVTFIPFTSLSSLPQFILTRLQTTAGQYPYTTVHAFNLWQLIHGSWQSDARLQALGWLLFLTFPLTFLIRTKFQLTPRLLAGIFLAAFLFLTRMHERHLLLALPFLLLTQNWGLYSWYSLAYILNLVFSYQTITTNYQSQFLSFPLTRLISLLNLVGLIWLLFPLKLKFSLSPSPSVAIPDSPTIIRLRPLLLGLILSFALVTRIIRLGIPPEFYFDEVYHAFTATELLKGKPQAWEWWNPNPENVAFEWTHPPLAKHFMVASMWLFGPTPFAWRLPGVLISLGAIWLVYLLTRHFLKSTTIALLAAALLALDGLNFVQARLGMNDIYLLFFLLLTLYLFLRQKYFISSIAFGLALSSKWSAVYLLPVLVLTRIILVRQGLSLKLILVASRYWLVAILIYLLAYLPFFSSGHTWSQFWQLHQQMYWYHTRLTATHNYQSAAWTWPLDLRPVWYYVDHQDDTIANIYALGSPLIFWAGLLAVIYTVAQIIFKKIPLYSNYTLLAISYLLLFLPWAFSPRIMFLYHYLPATPFMIILLSWALTHFPKKIILAFVICNLALFIFFYPLWTAIPIPKVWANIFFWLPSWK